MTSKGLWFGILMAGALWDSSAGACGNEVYRATRKQVAEVKAAETTLDQRHFLWAGTAILKNVPRVRARTSHPGYASLVEPAVRVMALLTVRTGGMWLTRPKDRGAYRLQVSTEEQRLENLDWAVESLRLNWPRPSAFEGEMYGMLERAASVPKPPSPPSAGEPTKPVQPSNPRDASNLGEALEALPKHHAEARELLERLAEEDLITSGYAYAALARLRAEAGDKERAQQALRHCRKMSGKRAHRVCRLERPQADISPASPNG